MLSSDDGIRWFKFLHLKVTKSILEIPPGNGWAAPVWVTRLDVVFPTFYFETMARFLRAEPGTPSSWDALFEARHTGDIDRIQFALAGMNADVNHDLSLALLRTDSELQLVNESEGSPAQ